jgi:hypothetical protein
VAAIPPERDGVDPAKQQAVEASAKRILEEGSGKDAPAKPAEYEWLAEQNQAQEMRIREAYALQELNLRETYAKNLLRILAAELVAVNVMFWLYAEVGHGWNVPDAVIQIWLGATVVQVVGIVAVVTRYLFPNRDGASPATLPAPPDGNAK